MDTVALVLAAGRGERLGAGPPKQYRPLGGQPMLRRSLSAFSRHPRIGGVRTLIRPGDLGLFEDATAGLDLMPPVEGGPTRQDSCLRGLESLADRPPARVVIHDGARPLVDADTIDRVLDALDRAPGAIAALPANDTMKLATEDVTVAATVDRRMLWRAQTPQGFDYPAILEAHRAAAGRGLTDDAAVAEAAGLTVVLVRGSEQNLKVTTDDEFRRAERLIAGGEIHVGTGFDVHRFGPGDHIVLCGVTIPYERGLVGHSDADVGLHALTDAILGAIGASDIGTHFPQTDPRWKGEDSATFLRHAAALVAERGGMIRHLDLTVICERPKISVYREAMQARIAEIVGIDTSRVSVKATTTEGLGATGHNKGIAAQAAATVAL